ncbi:hypothetical protein RvVAR0630_38890 [Agrobacterium vitis]|nr:hypothetical protein RvVAR0630_38890 [Agrobacterium vitis]
MTAKQRICECLVKGHGAMTINILIAHSRFETEETSRLYDFGQPQIK